MNGFIDRARDYRKLGLFDSDELPSVNASLDFYESLRTELAITEEDIENVENLLSLAEVYKLLDGAPVSETTSTDLLTHIRRFIVATITKSVNLHSPSSAGWIGLDEPMRSYKSLAHALMYHGANNNSVISLNYDTVLEYVCHCMGVPYTYNRNDAPGVEILKLHGSVNWLHCSNVQCSLYRHIDIAEVDFTSHAAGTDTGYLKVRAGSCSGCNAPLVPLIVPPAWGKDLDHPMLRMMWHKAAEALRKSECLLAIGFSLSTLDTRIRQLLHVGLSSRRLRQALIVVGSDTEAKARWESLFRQSWRQKRLEVHQTTFTVSAEGPIFDAFSIPKTFVELRAGAILPLSNSPIINADVLKKLHQGLQERGHKYNGVSPLGGVHWVHVVQEKRRGKEPAESTKMYRDIISEIGCDWLPSSTVLPSGPERRLFVGD